MPAAARDGRAPWVSQPASEAAKHGVATYEARLGSRVSLECVLVYKWSIPTTACAHDTCTDTNTYIHICIRGLVAGPCTISSAHMRRLPVCTTSFSPIPVPSLRPWYYQALFYPPARVRRSAMHVQTDVRSFCSLGGLKPSSAWNRLLPQCRLSGQCSPDRRYCSTLEHTHPITRASRAEFFSTPPLFLRPGH
jgi:hypothetical protein